jgi:hypothetical protein
MDMNKQPRSIIIRNKSEVVHTVSKQQAASPLIASFLTACLTITRGKKIMCYRKENT